MHDQPIQLDEGFDHTPRLSVSSWLHTIDSRVVSGEPIVIIDDGTTQRVVTAPCTGRIVDVYTEVGAQVLPRTVLGMVRPDLIMPEPKYSLGSVVLSILMIGLAVLAIPIVTNVSPVSMPSVPSMPSFTDRNPALPSDPETNPANTTSTDSPMPDAPAPGSSPNMDITSPNELSSDEQTSPDITEDMSDPNQFLESPSDESNADVNESNADTLLTDEASDTTDIATNLPGFDANNQNQSTDDESLDPQTPPDMTDNPNEQPISGFMSNIDITERFMFDVDRIIALTTEVERNLPSGVMSQSEYDVFVESASNDVIQLIDDLSQIISNNRDNTNINNENRRWFASFNDAKEDCLTIYMTIKQSVQSQQPLPNLTSSFTGCYVLIDNF